MSKPLKLDLGCGRKLYGKGWIGIDKSEHSVAEYKLDFTKVSLPFKDCTVDEIRSAHTFEHITGIDLIFLMNECWRVMKWEKKMWIYVPEIWCDLAWQDPTHKNYFVESSFKFFCGEYLIKHKLDYGIKCTFFEFQEPRREFPTGTSSTQKQYCTMLKFCLLKSGRHHNECKKRFPFNIKDVGKAVKAEAQTQLPVKSSNPTVSTKPMHDPEWFLNTRWKTEHNMNFSDIAKRIAKHAINKHMKRIVSIKVDASLRYGENSAAGGAAGLLSDLRRKFTRIEGFFKHDRQSTTENIIDTLFDNAVYSILAVMAIEEGKIEEIMEERKDD